MKRSSKPRPTAPKQFADIVRLATEQGEMTDPGYEPDPTALVDPVSAYLVEVGRRGGLKGGRAKGSSIQKRRKP